jgi:Leucine-rich repeat (LRR) protein
MQTEIQDYFNGLCCTEPVVTYNFDVDSSSWAGVGITNQATFNSVLGVSTDQFLLTGNNIQANILTTTSNSLNLNSKNITNVDYITIPSLQVLQIINNQLTNFNPTQALPGDLIGLFLDNNNLTTFNPSIALPSTITDLGLSENDLTSFNPSIALPTSLTNLQLSLNPITVFNPSIALPSGLLILTLENCLLTSFNPSIALPSSLENLLLEYNQLTAFNPSIELPITLLNLTLNGNQMDNAGYTTSETWANLQTPFNTVCNIYLQSNIDSASGTTFEAILSGKNASLTT